MWFQDACGGDEESVIAIRLEAIGVVSSIREGER